MEYSGNPVQTLDLDSLSHPSEELCSWEQMANELRQDGVKALQDAGAGHDELEKIYNPYVNFEKVQALADLETNRLLGWLSEKKN